MAFAIIVPQSGFSVTPW